MREYPAYDTILRMQTGYLLEEKAKKYAKRLSAIGSSHRLCILHLLADRPMELHDLVSYLDMSQALVAHHIGILFRAGWVEKEKKGRVVVYSVRPLAFTWFSKFFADTGIKKRS